MANRAARRCGVIGLPISRKYAFETLFFRLDVDGSDISPSLVCITGDSQVKKVMPIGQELRKSVSDFSLCDNGCGNGVPSRGRYSKQGIGA